PDASAFTLDPDDVDDQFPAAGTPMRLGDVLDRMIYRSSNEATNMVLELIGFDAVNDTICDAGLTLTRLTRPIGDRAAEEAGMTQPTSACDLARLMRSIASGGLTSARSKRFMITTLEHQQYTRIADGL